MACGTHKHYMKIKYQVTDTYIQLDPNFDFKFIREEGPTEIYRIIVKVVHIFQFKLFIVLNSNKYHSKISSRRQQLSTPQRTVFPHTTLVICSSGILPTLSCGRYTDELVSPNILPRVVIFDVK
jgi:hypothetical protein